MEHLVVNAARIERFAGRMMYELASLGKLDENTRLADMCEAVMRTEEFVQAALPPPAETGDDGDLRLAVVAYLEAIGETDPASNVFNGGFIEPRDLENVKAIVRASRLSSAGDDELVARLNGEAECLNNPDLARLIREAANRLEVLSRKGRK